MTDKKKSDILPENQNEQQPIMPDLSPLMDQVSLAPDKFDKMLTSLDSFVKNVSGLNKEIGTLTSEITKGLNKDTKKPIHNNTNQKRIYPDNQGSRVTSDQSTTRRDPYIDRLNSKQENYMDNVTNFNDQQDRRYKSQEHRNNTGSYGSSMSTGYVSDHDRYRTASGTRPHIGGKVGQTIGEDIGKNMLQMGHMMSPMSFMTYSLMFGAGFPLQMKMAETLTRPVTDVGEKFEVGRRFSSSFTGIGDAMTGFTSQMMQSPFNMYESLYQSQMLLSSALGGDRQAGSAVDTALKMAREYPVKTEQVLSSLSRLSVYPETKPYLQDSNFQKKLMESVSGLSLIVPEQGMEGAMFSLIEAMSGSQRSLQMRFNVSPEVVESLSGMSKGEMSSDPNKLIEGLHRFIGKSVGLDVLEKQKYTFTKQVDNFGDSLQMMTRNVFEQTGLYKTITGGATAFQTGFSSLSENKGFLNFVGSIAQPFQQRTDKAFADFVGMPVGQYQQTPMSQITKIIEENFEDMSYEDIGERFSKLVDDMGGVWRDTNKAIDTVINKAFGKTLSDIGGDIADVVSSSFQQMVVEVSKGFVSNAVSNPMQTLGVMGAITLPMATILGSMQIGSGIMYNAFTGKTMGQRAMQLKDTLFNTYKERSKMQQGGAYSGMRNNQSGFTTSATGSTKSSSNDSSIKRGMYNTANDIDLGEKLYKTKSTASFNPNVRMSDDEKSLNKYGREYRTRDAGDIVNRVSEINAKNSNIISNNLLADTTVRRNRAVDMIKYSDSELPFAMTNSQRNQFNNAINNLSLDALGVPKDLKNISSISDLSDSDFRKTTGYKDFTKSPEIKRLLDSGDINAFKSVRNMLESEILEKSSNVAWGTAVHGRAELGSSALKGSILKPIEFKDIINDIKGSTREVQDLTVGRVDKLEIDAKNAKILNSNLGEDFTKRRKQQSGIPSATDMTRKATKYMSTSEQDAMTDTKSGEDFLNAVKKFNTQVSKEGTIKEVGVSDNYISRMYGADTLDNLDRSSYNLMNDFGKNVKKYQVNPNAYASVLGTISDKTPQMGSLGKDIENNLLKNDPWNKFVSDQRGFMATLSQSTPTEQARLIRGVELGSQQYRTILKPQNIDKISEIGGGRFKLASGLANLQESKLVSNFRNSGLGKVLSSAVLGAFTFADIPLIGMQASSIAKNMGASDSASKGIGVGTALGVGGILGAESYRRGTKLGATGLNRFITGGKELFGKTLVTTGGVLGMGGLYAGLETIRGYSEGSRQLRERKQEFDTQLSSYGLNTNEYNQFSSTMDNKRGRSSNEGFKEIGNNVGSILFASILGGVGVALTGGALAPILAGAGIAGGGTTLASYFLGEGNLSESEKYASESIMGFLGNRKYFTDKSQDISHNIDYLQQKSNVTALTFDERVKLKNLEIDKAKIDTLASASLESAKETTNITTGASNFKDPSIKLSETEMIAVGGSTGAINPISKYSDIEKNIFGYVNSLNNRDTRTPENKIGSFLALQAYTTDRYGEEVQKTFDSGDERAIKSKSMNYVNVLKNIDSVYQDAMGSTNIQDPNQVEIMKQARASFIKNIKLPLGDSDQMQNMRDALGSMLMSDFMEANINSVISNSKQLQNSNSAIAVASENKLAQLGISNTDVLSNDYDRQSNSNPGKFTDSKFKFSDISSNRNMLKFLSNQAGVDDLATDSIADDNKIFNMLSMNDTDLKDMKRQYHVFLGEGTRAQADRQFNDMMDNLGKFRSSEGVQKRTAYDDLRAGALRGSISIGSTRSDMYDQTNRMFKALGTIDFTGFSGRQKDSLSQNLTVAENAKNALMNSRVKMQTVIDGDESLQGIDIDNLSKSDVTKIGNTELGADLFKEIGNSTSDFTNALNVLNNATQVTSKSVEGKLTQSLEKTGVLMKNLSITGGSLRDSNHMNQLRTNLMSSSDGIVSLRKSADRKESMADLSFKDVLKSTDLQDYVLSNNLSNANINDMMAIDSFGKSGFDRMSYDINNKMSSGEIGVEQGEKLLKLLSNSRTSFAESKELRTSASVQAFEYMEQLGKSSSQLTASGSKFFAPAKMFSNANFDSKVELRNNAFKNLKMSASGYLQSDTKEQKAYFKEQLMANMQALAGFGVTTNTMKKEMGIENWDKISQDLTSLSIGSDPVYNVQKMNKEATGVSVDTGDEKLNKEFNQRFNNDILKKVKNTSLESLVKNQLDTNGKLSAQQVQMIMEMPKDAKSMSVDSKTGENIFYDADGNVIEKSQNNETANGLRIENVSEIASAIANALSNINTGGNTSPTDDITGGVLGSTIDPSIDKKTVGSVFNNLGGSIQGGAVATGVSMSTPSEMFTENSDVIKGLNQDYILKPKLDMVAGVGDYIDITSIDKINPGAVKNNLQTMDIVKNVPTANATTSLLGEPMVPSTYTTAMEIFNDEMSTDFNKAELHSNMRQLDNNLSLGGHIHGDNYPVTADL